MDKIILAKGVLLLSKAFPLQKFDVEFFWMNLQKIQAEDYEKAILKIIQEVQEIRPGTNIVALIREFARQNAKERVERTPRLTDQRGQEGPPPKEWLDLMAKHGLKSVWAEKSGEAAEKERQDSAESGQG